MSKKNVKVSIGIDIGTGFAATGMIEPGGRYRMAESPVDGQQTPTIVYRDEKTGTFRVGSDAVLHSFGDKGDNLFVNVKRSLDGAPFEKRYGDKQLDAVSVTSHIVAHKKNLLVTAFPHIRDFPQFGGSKRPEDELSIIFTIPAHWGVPEQDALRRAIEQGGLPNFDGFIAEPKAAVREAIHRGAFALQDGEVVVCIDAGAGTTDIAGMKKRGHVLDQVMSAGGVQMAGADFTAVVAERAAKQLRVSWPQEVFGEGGFQLHAVSPRHRESVWACIVAGEELKRKLSQLGEATVAVNLPKGRKTFSMTRAEAIELWQKAGLFTRFRESVKEAFAKGGLNPSVADLVVLAGGSSATIGLREATAEAVGREVDDIHVITDSGHLIAAGAAVHGLYQDDAKEALESGLGFRIFSEDHTSNEERNLLFVPPGEILPAGGRYVNKEGFVLDTTSGNSLVLKPVVCKRDVVIDGPWLDDAQVLQLEEINVSVDSLPNGRFPVECRLKIDHGRNVWLHIALTEHPEIEPISAQLAMKNSSSENSRASSFDDVLLVLDCSGSMAGEKLRSLQKAATDFVALMTAEGASVGVVGFGMLSWSTGSVGQMLAEIINGCAHAKVLCPMTRDAKQAQHAISSLRAMGGTPMAAGLRVSLQCLSEHERSVMAVVFTDGHPTDADTESAASELKKRFPLYCVGIGFDVQEDFLRALATSPKHYSFAKGPENIERAFRDVAQLLFDGSRHVDANNVPGPSAPSGNEPEAESTTTATPEDADHDDDDDWDDMEAA